MKAHRVAAVVLRQVYLFRGSLTRLAPLVMWVTIDIVLWGFITMYFSSISDTSFDLGTVLLGAVLLWSFFGRIMYGISTAFFEDVWSRNFLNFFATPLSTAEYITGLIVTSMATGALALGIMFPLAMGIFGLSYAVYGIMLAPFLLVLLLFGVALGIFAISVVLRLGPAAEWFIWPVPGMLSPFVGVFYPLAVLPAPMQWIGYALPPSYVFEAMRGIVIEGSFPVEALVWSVTLACGYLLAAVAVFGATFRYAVRTGLLARYSAESAA